MVNSICTGEPTRPFRAVILDKALDCTLGDRQDAYGPPSGALTLAAEFILLYKKIAGDKYCAAHDAAINLMLLKLARIACGAIGHNDNYVDGAAYFAIAAECQHLHQPSEMPLKKWCEDNSFLNPNRLAEADAKYKAAVALDQGMKNPYAPVNRKV